jgi:hypothetical protein
LADGAEVWAALTESLALAVSLDDRTARHWSPGSSSPTHGWFKLVPGAQAVPGVRWVRNAVHHQWADALSLSPSSGGRYPPRGQEWVWRPATELPGTRPGRRRSGRDRVADGTRAYETYMADRPADFTLSILAECYDEVADR